MVILALDISSVKTGFSIFKNNLLDSYGTIEPDKKDCLGLKLLFFENQVKELIKQYNPNEVIIEDIFKGPNQKTFKILSMFSGVAIKTIYDITGAEPIRYMATNARKLAGVGQKKEEAFEIIKNKYQLNNFNFKQHNDIVDSMVLANAHIAKKA